MMNSWDGLSLAGGDPIFGLNQVFLNDTNPSKISLIIGAYRDNDGKPYIFETVRKVEEEMTKEVLNKEYLSMEGDPEFREGAKKLVFGDDPRLLERIATVQTLSGSGALRIGGIFLSYAAPKGAKIYLSNPTWPNHIPIFNCSGLTNQHVYPYFDSSKNALNFEGMMEVIGKAEPRSIMFFHGCAHNPTGVDPTKEQWQEIVRVCKERDLIPFIDLAYQGFATGDLDNDAYAIRLFVEQGMNVVVAQSFAKNAGLYNERIGALHVVCPNPGVAAKVFSNLQMDIRGMYSNPPAHGARIMARILRNPTYFGEWKKELKAVSGRIQSMRKLLYDELVDLKTPGNWEHILHQIGMFSYTGLSEAQVAWMSEKHHVYLLKSGRASMAGINTKNVKYLASAISDAVVSVPKKKA